MLRRASLRRHLKQCAPCDAYRLVVSGRRGGLGALLPVAPTAGLKAAVLGGAGLWGGESANAAVVAAAWGWHRCRRGRHAQGRRGEGRGHRGDRRRRGLGRPRGGRGPRARAGTSSAAHIEPVKPKPSGAPRRRPASTTPAVAPAGTTQVRQPRATRTATRRFVRRARRQARVARRLRRQARVARRQTRVARRLRAERRARRAEIRTASIPSSITPSRPGRQPIPVGTAPVPRPRRRPRARRRPPVLPAPTSEPTPAPTTEPTPAATVTPPPLRPRRARREARREQAAGGATQPTATP